MITYGGAGSLQSGKFKGKMIVVESLMDQDAFPWQADWYRSKVKDNLGRNWMTPSGSGTPTMRSTGTRKSRKTRHTR